MVKNLINEIEQAMLSSLNNEQLAQLRKVLDYTFRNIVVTEKDAVNTESNNQILVENFISAKKVEGCSPNSIAYYRSTINNALIKLGKEVIHITTDDLRHYLNTYQSESGASKVTVDNIRRILSSFFSWLEEENYIVKSPVRRIHKVKVGKTVKETYTDESLELMRDHCSNPRDLALIDLLASTGMRVGELVKLNRSDIDYHNRECIVTGKGDKQRKVYFDARTKIHLQKYINSRTDSNEALFVSLLAPYERLQISGVEIRLRQMGKDLNIPKVHPHKFRRTLATMAIDKGMPIEQVQHLLGHQSLDTTLQYAMVNQNNVKLSHHKSLVSMSQFIEMYYNTHNKQTLESVCPIMNKGITPKYVESSSVLVINQACIHWDGQRLGNIKYHNEEIPVRKRILESGDVLLNATGNGTLGRCCVFICPSDNNTYINDGHVIALSTDRAVILPEVLNTYLSLNDTQAEIYRQYVTGSTNQVDIVFSDIKKMKVPVPSMDEQILFVEVLTQADKSEFVGCKSQFIEIFYGMETTPVKDYIDDSFPGEWGTEDKDGNGVKVIRTTNFTNSGKLNLADVVTRSIEDRKVVRKQIKKYDTILERSGGTADNPVGRVVLFEEDNLFLCNNFTQVLRFKDVDPRFAFYALYYFYQTNRTAIRSMGSKTTGIQNLNMSKYLEIGIPNASDEDQKAFVTIAEQADKSEYYN